MATAAANRREAPEGRVCAFCGVPLPEAASSWRKYCSSRCRGQAWDRDNPPARTESHPNVGKRLHWHIDPQRMVRGDVSAGPWFGPGCPPECPGLDDPRGWSGGIPEPYHRGTAPGAPDVPPDVERRISAWFDELLRRPRPVD
jgi:hypothetical protein